MFEAGLSVDPLEFPNNPKLLIPGFIGVCGAVCGPVV